MRGTLRRGATAGGGASPKIARDLWQLQLTLRFSASSGTTHFQVIYKLPYSGSTSIDPRSLYPWSKNVGTAPGLMLERALKHETVHVLSASGEQTVHPLLLRSVRQIAKYRAFSLLSDGRSLMQPKTGFFARLETWRREDACRPFRTEPRGMPSFNLNKKIAGMRAIGRQAWMRRLGRGAKRSE